MPAQQPRSGPSFQPRNFCVNPKSFGRSLDAEWRVPNRSNRALFDAAQLQHRFAWQVIQQLGARGWSRKDLAAALDVDYQRLTQILNGLKPMRLADVGPISRALQIPPPWGGKWADVRVDRASQA